MLIHTRDEVGELALAFNRMVEELRSRERVKETFGKFVDPRVVSRLIGSGTDQAERRTLTIFFSDIAAFSGISEQLTAGAIVNLLNSYFGAVAEVIHAHHGGSTSSALLALEVCRYVAAACSLHSGRKPTRWNL